MRFSHLADCHLGSWRQPELRQLNLKNFQEAIERSIKEKVELVIITGDLFDSAYPPVEILEETFFQLKTLKDAGIPCFYIAGSHDYSASGKTFLSVLEKAGFCKNMHQPEEKGENILLNPIVYKNIALYGYPGKKSGMEVNEIKRIKLQDAPGLFKILALHTSIKNAIGSLPIDSVDETLLPKADYYALGHLHIDYEHDNFVYAGPTFPNNFQELEELELGSFYIIETEPFQMKRIKLGDKKPVSLELEIKNALTATDKILAELDKLDLKDKIVLLKLHGKLEQGKASSIDFRKIEESVKAKGAYSILKNISKLITEEPEFKMEIEDMNKLEDEIIKKYCQDNQSKLNILISPLLNALSLEKHEDENSQTFALRLFNEFKKATET
jgi:DNA repair exonuclease SbcCD nuclease subunit